MSENQNPEPAALQGFLAQRKKKRRFLILLSAAAAALFVLSLCAGSSGMGVFKSLAALFGRGEAADILIVRSVRLPRAAAALTAGGGLAAAGCVMQCVLKNPMASPATLGVSSAAVFGANIAITLLGAGALTRSQGDGLIINNPYLVTLCAFLAALICVLLILALSKSRNFSPYTVVLSGVAVGALFSAGTTIVQYFAADTRVAAAVYWSFGDLSRAGRGENLIMLGFISAAFIFFYSQRLSYNALENGADIAKSLGVNTARLSLVSLLLSSLICAVTVSFLGVIGFVGLIAPHAVRRFTGADYRFLLPACAVAGAALLLISDTAARSIPGITLPTGAVTSLLGGPVFLWLILRKGERK